MVPTQSSSLTVLREKVRACRQCPISAAEASGKPTPSSGALSPIWFVGRNPGIQERDAGVPFIGKTKRDVDSMIEALGYNRYTLYITNLVKCYTSLPKPDRPPTNPEINFCAGLHLERELALGLPKLVVTLGKDAWCYFNRDDPTMRTCTGHTGTFRKLVRYPFYIFCLHHPAVLLYNPHKYAVSMEEDFQKLFHFCKVMKLLGPNINAS